MFEFVLRWSAHLSMLFADLPEADRPRAAAEAGFGTVETWWPENDREHQGWIAEVRRLGLEVALINFPAGDIGAGERGRLNLVGDDEKILADFDRALAVAVAVGAPRMNLLTGLDDGERPREEQLALASERVTAAARRAAAVGIEVVLEPLNRLDTPDYLICDIPTALEVADRIDEQVGILYDVFHAARNGRDPLSEIARYGDRISHVHYADHPGRGVPGSGGVELAAVIDALRAVGYEGAIGLELDRGGTAAASLPDLLPGWPGVSPASPPAPR